MIKGYTKIFKPKAIHDFDALFNAKSIECFVFSISYTVPEIIFKKLEKTRKVLKYLLAVKLFYKKRQLLCPVSFE